LFCFREFTDETETICIVQMPSGSIYEGHGKSKKLAKYDACQKALDSER
jgi:dsRNA-specific ribonuclease